MPRTTNDIKLTQREISAADLLSGASTIRKCNASTCELNNGWMAPAAFLEWARRGLAEADDHGLSNAITYAKRAACCRIDRLIHNYHLRQLHRAPFGAKIETLNRVGLQIPNVILELIISPRNDLEHDYIPANLVTARRALDIASLFLTATEEIDAQDSVIALNMNMLFSHECGDGGQRVAFNGWSCGAMLFIDVFDEPHRAKIVDAARREVLYTNLSSFTRTQAVEFARILRSHFTAPTHGSTGAGEFFYKELKRLAEF